mgnify:CR=1 FL=1
MADGNDDGERSSEGAPHDGERGESGETFVAPQSRRRFLALMAGSAGATVLSPLDLAHAAAAGAHVRSGEGPVSMTWSMQFTRTADLVDLKFTFHNLTVIASPSPHLAKMIDADAFMIVEFPPQHVAERCSGTRMWRGELVDEVAPLRHHSRRLGLLQHHFADQHLPRVAREIGRAHV